MSGARWPFCRGMDTKRWTLAVAATAAMLGGCATKNGTTEVTTKAPQPMMQTAPTAIKEVPKETPAQSLADHAGDSIETAIAVPADAANGGWNFTNDWIFDRIGKFRRTGGGTGMAGERRYNVVEVETPKGDHYKFFFDITENWNRWTPPAQPE
jgi:hypothetical protein